MDPRQRVAMIRLVVLSAAWAVGEALVWQFPPAVAALGLVVPALLAAAAFVATRDVSAFRGDNVTYYRGRRIDKDRWH